MGYLTQICRVCSQPLKQENQFFRFLWNDNKNHYYNLYCSNPYCGIKYLRKMNRKEYLNFLEYSKQFEQEINDTKENLD